MNNWKESTLGDFIFHKKGFAFKSQWFVNHGIPIVKVTDFTDESINTSNLDYVEESIATNKQQYQLQTGDSVVQTVGSWPNNPASVVGKVIQVPQGLNGALLNQNAVILRPKKELDKGFLFYLLKSELFKGFIINMAQGAANQASITLDSIFKFPFYRPPLGTQIQIAEILTAYDDLIEINNQRIATLEQLAQQIYKEWFVRMRFPGWEQAHFHHGVPDGWEVKPLDSFCEFVMGQSPSSEFYNENGLGLPFHQGVSHFKCRFPTNKIFCSSNGRLAELGDILFSVRAPVGRINIATDKVIIGRGLAAIRHNEDFQTFLFYLLSAYFKTEDIIGNGAIFNSVSKNELSGFKVLYPPISLIRKFTKIVKPAGSRYFCESLFWASQPKQAAKT